MEPLAGDARILAASAVRATGRARRFKEQPWALVILAGAVLVSGTDFLADNPGNLRLPACPRTAGLTSCSVRSIAPGPSPGAHATPHVVISLSGTIPVPWHPAAHAWFWGSALCLALLLALGLRMRRTPRARWPRLVGAFVLAAGSALATGAVADAVGWPNEFVSVLVVGVALTCLAILDRNLETLVVGALVMLLSTLRLPVVLPGALSYIEPLAFVQAVVGVLLVATGIVFAGSYSRARVTPRARRDVDDTFRSIRGPN